MWQVCRLYLGVFTVLEDHIPGGDRSVLLSPTQQAHTSCICRPRTVVTVFRSPLTASLVKNEAFIYPNLSMEIIVFDYGSLSFLSPGGRGFLLASGCVWKDVWIIVALREDAVLVCLLASLWNQYLGTQPFTQWKHRSVSLWVPGTDGQNLVTYHMPLEGRNLGIQALAPLIPGEQWTLLSRDLIRGSTT